MAEKIVDELSAIKERRPDTISRKTVADGDWLQYRTLSPLSARDVFLASAIDSSNTNVNAISGQITELSGKSLTLDDLSAGDNIILTKDTTTNKLTIDTNSSLSANNIVIHNNEYIINLSGNTIVCSGADKTESTQLDKIIEIASGDYVEKNATVCTIGSGNSAEIAAMTQGVNNSANHDAFAQGDENIASNCALAQGNHNSASYFSLAQGYSGYATDNSLALGNNVSATNNSLAQGSNISSLNFSFAQGLNVKSRSASFGQGDTVYAGDISLTQGETAFANGFSFAQGRNVSSTNNAFAQGVNVTSTLTALAQGNVVTAANLSFAQGDHVTANDRSFALGCYSYASSNSFVLGSGSVTSGSYASSRSFALGELVDAKQNSFSLGLKCFSDSNSMGVGGTAFATSNSFAQGSNVSAIDNSFAQGYSVYASGTSFAQGSNVSAIDNSFARGNNINVKNNTIALGYNMYATTAKIMLGNDISSESNDPQILIGGGIRFDSSNTTNRISLGYYPTNSTSYFNVGCGIPGEPKNLFSVDPRNGIQLFTRNNFNKNISNIIPNKICSNKFNEIPSSTSATVYKFDSSTAFAKNFIYNKFKNKEGDDRLYGDLTLQFFDNYSTEFNIIPTPSGANRYRLTICLSSKENCTYNIICKNFSNKNPNASGGPSTDKIKIWSGDSANNFDNIIYSANYWEADCNNDFYLPSTIADPSASNIIICFNYVWNQPIKCFIDPSEKNFTMIKGYC